ncbi:hypothetical protein BURKHO8Y_60011 [Burkholderia sp. 8Y]|nr:hypothetical protein BURKHO8Y_60011 [Burkholderia sp. 8Y]
MRICHQAKGFGSWAALSELAEPYLLDGAPEIPLCCTDVFGPYDYVVEFPVRDREQLEPRMSRLLDFGPFAKCVARMQWWFCQPFDQLSP